MVCTTIGCDGSYGTSGARSCCAHAAAATSPAAAKAISRARTMRRRSALARGLPAGRRGRDVAGLAAELTFDALAVDEADVAARHHLAGLRQAGDVHPDFFQRDPGRLGDFDVHALAGMPCQ